MVVQEDAEAVRLIALVEGLKAQFVGGLGAQQEFLAGVVACKVKQVQNLCFSGQRVTIYCIDLEISHAFRVPARNI